MEIINFSEQNSIVNQYMAEIRDKDYQRNRLLFRNNVMRIGEFEAFEISKTLQYEMKEVHIENTRTRNTTKWAFTLNIWQLQI